MGWGVMTVLVWRHEETVNSEIGRGMSYESRQRAWQAVLRKRQEEEM